METRSFGLIELALTFGGLLIFCAWQFNDLHRYKTGTKTDKPKPNTAWSQDSDATEKQRD